MSHPPLHLFTLHPRLPQPTLHPPLRAPQCMSLLLPALPAALLQQPPALRLPVLAAVWPHPAPSTLEI
ncbi:hypothetical protein E4T45_14735 [Aureobasidium sp. EXF-8846]|nr:hypothetical protein E4T45_14735 [Aureobasidium sp. EXF-8846]